MLTEGAVCTEASALSGGDRFWLLVWQFLPVWSVVRHDPNFTWCIGRIRGKGGFGGISLSRDVLPDILIELRGAHVVERFRVHSFDQFNGKFADMSLWLVLVPLHIEKANPVW